MIPRRDTLLKGALFFWSAVPLLHLATLYADAWHTASVHGHLPLFGREGSPNDAFSHIVEPLGLWLLLALIVSPFAWSFLLALNHRLRNRADGRVHAFVYSFGWIAVILLDRLDPGDIIRWWGYKSF